MQASSAFADQHFVRWTTLARAMEWTTRWVGVASLGKRRSCVVTDLDDTLLAKGSLRPLTDVTNAISKMRTDLGVVVVVITARNELGRELTEGQLAQKQVVYDELLMHPADMPLESSVDAAKQKALWRQSLVDRDMDILAVLGDQAFDHTTDVVDLTLQAPSDAPVVTYLDEGGVAHVYLRHNHAA